MTSSRMNFKHIYVLSVPYFAALSAIKGPEFFGYSYKGFIWVSFLLFGIIFVLGNTRKVAFPWKLWTPWFSLVGFSLFWGTTDFQDSLQAFLQILTPFFVGMVSSFTIVRSSDWLRFQRASTHCLILTGVAFLFFYYGPGRNLQAQGDIYFNPRPTAMTLSYLGCLFLATTRSTSRKQILQWAICVAIVVLSGSRMGMAVLLSIWIVSPSRLSIVRRIVVCIVIGISAVILFYTPTVQDRFFYSGEGTLSQIPEGDFADSGRFKLWPEIYYEAKKHMVFGAGVGSSDQFVAMVHDDMNQAHNDYLRIFFEIGLVGLTVFVITMVVQMARLKRIIGSGGRSSREAAAASFLGIVTWLMFSVTDNALIYGLSFTHPLFVMIGAAYGLRAGQSSAAAPAHRGSLPTEKWPEANAGAGRQYVVSRRAR